LNSREVAVEWIAEPRDRRAPWIVHINTSANGGGVAELIRAVIFSSNGGRNDLGWAVLRGGPQFYSFTKNLHHLLHGRGAPSDLLTAGAGRDVYRETLALALADIVAMVRPGDAVVLHDPQTGFGAGAGPARYSGRVALSRRVTIGSLRGEITGLALLLG
jgi:trehalose synthase